MKYNIRGPVFSIITPFCDDESVDYKSLSNYVKFLYEQGAKVFYVMGYNSRFSILSDEEIMKVNETVATTVKSFNNSDCITIIADPLHCSTETSISFAKHGKEIGANIISLIFREKVYFEDQVYQHFKRVSENSPIDILIHQMPFNNGIPGQPPLIRWSTSLTDRVADIPRVVAIKEDTKDDENTQTVIDVLADRLSIITSGKGMGQWLHFNGQVHAWLSGVGCFCPQAEIAFFRLYNAGDTEGCKKILNDIEFPFNEVIYKYGWHLGIKSAIDIAGVMSRFERMPLLQLPNNDHNEIVEIMKPILERSKGLYKQND